MGETMNRGTPAIRILLVQFVAALILVCVAGCFYIQAHRYSFETMENGGVLKMDSLSGRVWVLTVNGQFELGKSGK